MQLVLSPCGTSLLTNHAGEHRSLVTKISNARSPDEVPVESLAAARAVITKARAALAEATPATVHRLSAELNALSRLYGGDMAKGARDVHFLLCTDTWLGSETAALVQAWLEQHGIQAQVQRQTDLRTVSVDEFQVALSDLARWCADTLPGYRDHGFRVVFNLTGGFKSVNGFLQALAMIHADETVYVFEGEQSLLRLPRLPMRMAELDHVREHVQQLRRLARNLPADASGIPETFVFQVGGLTTLSAWGAAVWGELHRRLYEEKLWQPPSTLIRFGPQFEDSVAKKAPSPDRRRMVNQRLDDLAVLLEQGTNPRRLDFKKLCGNPRPPATHELDAWADQDAKRIFGHYEGDVFQLDRLDDALH